MQTRVAAGTPFTCEHRWNTRDQDTQWPRLVFPWIFVYLIVNYLILNNVMIEQSLKESNTGLKEDIYIKTESGVRRNPQGLLWGEFLRKKQVTLQRRTWCWRFSLYSASMFLNKGLRALSARHLFFWCDFYFQDPAFLPLCSSRIWSSVSPTLVLF